VEDPVSEGIAEPEKDAKGQRLPVADTERDWVTVGDEDT
jgi:hypothetical protein